MAIAARALKYRGAAEIIEREQLSPAQACRMLLSGAAYDRGRVAAIVVLAAATARHHFQPTNWNGDLERALAVKALDLTGDRRLFDNAAETARKIIQNHLRAVQYQARHGRRPNGIGFESLVPDSDRRKRGASHPVRLSGA